MKVVLSWTRVALSLVLASYSLASPNHDDRYYPDSRYPETKKNFNECYEMLEGAGIGEFFIEQLCNAYDSTVSYGVCSAASKLQQQCIESFNVDPPYNDEHYRGERGRYENDGRREPVPYEEKERTRKSNPYE